MTLTLGELLAEAHSKEITCVAGFKGLDKIILDCNIIDSPEILDWLKGGELVMTTGYVLWNNPAMINSIVNDLVKKNCVGLAFKTKRYFDKIPQIIIDRGNELDFPILELSYEMRMSDLSRFVYTNIFKNNLKTEERIYNIYSSLTRTIVSDKDINQSLYEITKSVPNPVFLLDKNFDLIAYEIPENNSVELGRYLKMKPGEPILTPELTGKIDRHYLEKHFRAFTQELAGPAGSQNLVIFPIVLEKETLGFLCFLETITVLNIDLYRMIEDINSIMVIQLLKNNIGLSPHALKNDFLNNVLLNKSPADSDLRHYCEMYGFDYQKKRICLVIEMDSYQSLSYNRRNTIYNSATLIAREILEQYSMLYYFTAHQNKLIYFLLFPIALAEKDMPYIARYIADALIERMHKHLAADNIKFQIGLSQVAQHIEHIAGSFRQALNAIYLGAKISPQSFIHSYSENLIYHLMDEAFSAAQLNEIYQESVYILDQYDEKNDANLSKVLETYVGNKFSSSKTAELLHIHRNTVFYRLDKIKEETNFDLNDERTLLKIQLGYYAKTLLKLRP